MKKTIFPAVLILICFLSDAEAANPGDSLTVSVFGKVFIYKPATIPQNLIIMISGDAGWKAGVLEFSESFSAMNNLVIGVDVLRYFKNLKYRTDECYNVAADFVQLAVEIEKRFDLPEYKPPVIMGYSSGATLVYGIMAQARAGTFIGGISLGFCPDIDLPRKLCEVNGLKVKEEIKGKRFILQPHDSLGNPWIVLNGKFDIVCNYRDVVTFMSRTKGAELITLPKVGHGFSNWNDFMPQWKDAFNRLIVKYEKNKPALVNIDDVKNLPLTITDPKTLNKEAPVALLISGDGGWYGFEQSIADNLARHDIPTIGLDSRKYFWIRKTPEKTTADMASALIYYGRKWERNKFILIGYSLGAEIVPFILNRLPAELRSKIQSSVLLSPATTTDFEIHISNMLGMGNRQNTYNTTEEIIKMQKTTTLVVFGEGENTRLPELLYGTRVIVRKIPGDHHYKFNLPLVMETMIENKIF